MARAPGLAAAHALLADAYRDLARPGPAAKALEKVVARRPRDAAALAALGGARLELARFGEALGSYRAAAAMAPAAKDIGYALAALGGAGLAATKEFGYRAPVAYVERLFDLRARRRLLREEDDSWDATSETIAQLAPNSTDEDDDRALGDRSHRRRGRYRRFVARDRRRGRRLIRRRRRLGRCVRRRRGRERCLRRCVIFSNLCGRRRRRVDARGVRDGVHRSTQRLRVRIASSARLFGRRRRHLFARRGVCHSFIHSFIHSAAHARARASVANDAARRDDDGDDDDDDRARVVVRDGRRDGGDGGDDDDDDRMTRSSISK